MAMRGLKRSVPEPPVEPHTQQQSALSKCFFQAAFLRGLSGRSDPAFSGLKQMLFSSSVPSAHPLEAQSISGCQELPPTELPGNNDRSMSVWGAPRAFISGLGPPLPIPFIFSVSLALGNTSTALQPKEGRLWE